MEFYENLAGDYDQMTRFRERLTAERALVQAWMQRYPAQTLLDVACGTGLHVILLHQLGVPAIGVDNSESMLAQARENATLAGVKAQWQRASMQHLDQLPEAKYDALWCLGNSFPHLLTGADANSAMRNFYQRLNPGGWAAIQVLNFDRILNQKERIVGIHRAGAKEFIRFYDFLPGLIQFNILIITWQETNNSHSWSSTTLYPFRQHELERLFLENGFTDLEFLGDMNFSPFDIRNSKNLIVIGKKRP